MLPKTNNLLFSVLKKPCLFCRLEMCQMDLLVRQARAAYLLAFLAYRIEVCSDFSRVPEKVRRHLYAARIHARVFERMLLWESEKIRVALDSSGIEPIVMKGAAYLLEGLPFSVGRLASDVDVLVPHSRLNETESLLEVAGWRQVKTNKYDQNYYREWMHELPPLRHGVRRTYLDVHHTILPLTARLKPSAEKMIAASVHVGRGELRILCPEDTVLHKVVHHFYSGEFDNSLRELVDLDGLLKAYAQRPGFWDRLAPRALEMDLIRPLYYGLRYARLLLSTPIPEKVLGDVQVGRPNPLAGVLMDLLVPRALMPDHPDKANRLNRVVRWCLYIRSHWIRMPPLMLARHLLAKALRRRKEARPATAST